MWTLTGRSVIDDETTVSHYECSTCGAEADAERGEPAPCSRCPRCVACEVSLPRSTPRDECGDVVCARCDARLGAADGTVAA